MNALDLIKDYKRNDNLKKAIRCKETGEVWPSIVDTAIALNTLKSTISMYLKSGKPWKGIHFEYVK